MGVHTLVSSVWTLPKPTVEVLFYCIEEVLTSDIGSEFRLALTISGIAVDVNFSCFALESEIVRVFTFFSLFASALLKVSTEHRLRVLTFPED